ncbi:MAG TPA: superoxide dismutase family protein [Thermoanaerobaculia bacterium]|nr:superoxide dismutase family protein [Thermoanaerobaculia bacterium]
MRKLALITFIALALACAHNPAGPTATATLSPTTGQTAKGTVTFTDSADGTQVVVNLTNVPPGVHGFHIHDGGSCADDAKAAGGHFNPDNMPHAAPDATSHHAGDFGNVTADDKGEVHATFVTHSVTVAAGNHSVVGHAVVLHANPDDLATQPTGNAGGRIACGVVTMAGSMQH